MAKSNNLKKQVKGRFWPAKAFAITLGISVALSVGSEILLQNISFVFAFLILLVIVLIGVMFDIIGIAVASCDISPFFAMASKKEKGAKAAIKLLKNADRVSNICNDVVGDMCSTISGAMCIIIIASVATMAGALDETIMRTLITSFIAAMTVGLKALGKSVGLNENRRIVHTIGKALAIFNYGSGDKKP